MCALTANRKGTSFQMSCCLLQHLITCSVINRKLDGDLRNLYDSHHAVPGQVQAIHISTVFFLSGIRHGKGIRQDTRYQCVVVSLCFLQLLRIINISGFCLLCEVIFITADELFLSVIIPLVCYERIQQ